MKKKNNAILVVSIIVTTILVTVAGLAFPFLRVARLQDRFNSITQGMKRNEVEAIMIEPSSFSGEGSLSGAWWNDDALPDSTERITSSLRFTQQTFLLTVTFEFTFDEANILVGKHRFD